MSNNITIAIVDPASSGEKYGEAAKKMGLKTVALMTRQVFPEILNNSLKAADYDEVYFYKNFDDTIDFLRGKKVKAMLPGDQTALKIIDLLADRLNLIGNPAESREQRINKALMKKSLKDKNIKCADYILCDEIQTALTWIKPRKYPVVLKPLEGMGSLQVKICNNEQEVKETIDAICKLDPLFTGVPGCFLVEEFIDGDEYFMNLMSHGNEERELISFAKYEKIQVDGFASVYRNIFSLPLDNALAKEIYPYVNDVNSALSVQYGISDVEFKISKTGPQFIELNNRLPGANTPYLIHKCSGFNCYSENIKVFLGEKGSRKPILFKKHYCVCCLKTDEEGVVQRIDGLDLVKKLPSFDSARIFSSIGKWAPRTSDLLTSWGYVYLIHEDPLVLKRDSQFVHDTMKMKTFRSSKEGS